VQQPGDFGERASSGARLCEHSSLGRVRASELHRTNDKPGRRRDVNEERAKGKEPERTLGLRAERSLNVHHPDEERSDHDHDQQDCDRTLRAGRQRGQETNVEEVQAEYGCGHDRKPDDYDRKTSQRSTWQTLRYQKHQWKNHEHRQ